MMRGATLILVSCVAAQVASREIKVECHEFHDFPPVKNPSPSSLADLNVKLVTVGGKYQMNISWAVNIDGSIEYLAGTRIVITGLSSYNCIYIPRLARANISQSNQTWFHYLVQATYGNYMVQAANLPLPERWSGTRYKFTQITVPKKRATQTTTQVPVVENTSLGQSYGTLSAGPSAEAIPSETTLTNLVLAIFGGLASLIILSSCFIIYKNCRANLVSFLGFKMLSTSPMVPVPVLMVYPAKNAAFQRAVVALAEFLQWHGGCSVAVDMWQQGKIAELGPMCWLAKQAKAADRVLIVCPQVEKPTSQLNDCPPSDGLPEPSIPAAAHDLYPLTLNMVAGHAKNAKNLSKFWVVQLGEQKIQKPNNLALELRACKTFCLMKDLIKLCRSLHTERQDTKEISTLIFGPETENSTVKLRKAVEKLGRDQTGIWMEMEPLKSVVTTV